MCHLLIHGLLLRLIRIIDSCVRKGLSHEAFCKETANPSSVPRLLWLEDDSGLTYRPGP